MVRIHILHAREPDPVAVVEADDVHGYRVGGPRTDIVNPEEAMLGLPSGRPVTADQAPEEWARGLILRFRSPDLAARIVHDDDPLPPNAEPIRARLHAVG
jgi:hypothetical protein